MKIVRTFNAIALLQEPNSGVVLHREHLIARGIGNVVTPVIHPRAAWRYFGFQAHPEEWVKVAVYAPNGYRPSGQEPGFFYWDGAWLPTPEAVYQTPETIRKGIELWAGALQFHAQIAQNMALKELSVGYEVDVDLIEYMFNFAIPTWLSQPYRLNRTSWVKGDGAVDVPRGYNAEQFLEVSLRPMGGLPIEAIASGNSIRTSPPLAPQLVGVLFTLQPQVEFTEGIYQIEQSPCIVVRELEIREYHTPFRYEPILTGKGGSELDYPVADFDLPVELSVMAAERQDAQAIANQIIHKVRDEGCLYIPPLDLTLGCYVEGGIGAGGGQDSIPLELEGGMGVATPSNIRGGLPTVVIRLVFKNLAN
jgi:hypothetical protein